jgi:hypothetical protein
MDEGTPAARGAEELPPLAERFPIYLRLFAIGLAAVVGLGLAVGVFTSADVWSAVAYSLVALSVVLLMSGGATGGGYTNLGVGALSNMFGGRRELEGDDGIDVARSEKRSMDLENRLAKGLRPGPNPQAFWQVIAGFAYLAIAVVIFVLI